MIISEIGIQGQQANDLLVGLSLVEVGPQGQMTVVWTVPLRTPVSVTTEYQALWQPADPRTQAPPDVQLAWVGVESCRAEGNVLTFSGPQGTVTVELPITVAEKIIEVALAPPPPGLGQQLGIMIGVAALFGLVGALIPATSKILRRKR